MTIDEAKNLTSHQLLHYGNCSRSIGPRGGVTSHSEVWRVNGQVKLWKRNDQRVQVPIKHGLYAYGYIDETNCHEFHFAKDCPCNVN